MLSELMLYKPVTEEIDMDSVEQLYDEMYNDKRKVNIVKSQVMEHLEGVEEGRYYVEQVKKELDLSEIGDRLDPTLEQENADCESESLSQHPDYQHIDPEQFLVEESGEGKDSIYRKIEILGCEELRRSTRVLDKHQMEVINIGVKYAKDVVKARREGNSIPKAPLLMVH